MSQNTSELFIETISSWGVDTVFGLPGDGINGVIEALRLAQERIRFIQVRHEEAAAFMACAYAKYTGKLGCCLATSGPGAIHLLNGLYDAKCDQAPVLAIMGQTYSDLKGSQFQQDNNLAQLFDDVSVYVQEVINPNQVEMLANEACRHALTIVASRALFFQSTTSWRRSTINIRPTRRANIPRLPGHRLSCCRTPSRSAKRWIS